MNTPSDLHNSIIPLSCTYSSEYQAIYEPSYNIAFVFVDEDEYESFSDEDWDDVCPLPNPSGIGRA